MNLVRLVAAFVFALVVGQSASAQFTTVINVPPEVAPTSIGSDTQVNLYEGGVLGPVVGGVVAGSFRGDDNDNIEINVFGGEVRSVLLYRGATINFASGSARAISLGENPALPVAGGVARISGGDIEYFTVFGSQAKVSGGSIGMLRALPGFERTPEGTFLFRGEVTISGGTIQEVSVVQSQLQITGGLFGGGSQFGHISTGGLISLTGSEFRLDDASITGLTLPGDSIVLAARDGAALTGTLADGSPFMFTLNGEQLPDQDYLAPSATLRLTLVPEPTSVALMGFALAIAGCVLRKR